MSNLLRRAIIELNEHSLNEAGIRQNIADWNRGRREMNTASVDSERDQRIRTLTSRRDELVQTMIGIRSQLELAGDREAVNRINTALQRVGVGGEQSSPTEQPPAPQTREAPAAPSTAPSATGPRERTTQDVKQFIRELEVPYFKARERAGVSKTGYDQGEARRLAAWYANYKRAKRNGTFPRMDFYDDRTGKFVWESVDTSLLQVMSEGWIGDKVSQARATTALGREARARIDTNKGVDQLLRDANVAFKELFKVVNELNYLTGKPPPRA